MKIIPKFASGGSYSWMYNQYSSVPPVQALPVAELAAPAKSDKEELSEKDFFNMLKELDGLPNEMKNIVTQLSGIFKYQSITGDSVYDLGTIYLDALYKVKVAGLHKDLYDKAMETVMTNGSLNEPAITPAGNILVKSDTGFSEITPTKFLESPEDYEVLTVSNLMNMRAYEPGMVNDRNAFNIAVNSMGYESFDALLDKAMEKIGSTTNAEDERIAVDASQAQELMKQLGDQGVDYYAMRRQKIDQTSATLINNLLTYIVNLMPKRAKTWAMLKTGIADENEAVKILAYNYLSGQASEEHRVTDYADPKNASGGSGSGGDSKLKSGFWYDFMNGLLGTYQEFSIIKDHGGMYLGKVMHSLAAPMFDEGAMSLKDYLDKSGLGYIQSGVVAIGDQVLAKDSYDNVMVDPSYGIWLVELPDTLLGSPDMLVQERYAELQKEIVRRTSAGADPEETYREVILNSPLAVMYDANSPDGWNHDYFSNYIVLGGITRGNTNVVVASRDQYVDTDINDYVPISDDIIDRTYMPKIDNPTDEQYKQVQLALGDSKKIKGNPWIGWWSGEPLYRCSIFILIGNNPVGAVLADKTEHTRGNDKSDVAAYQRWLRTKNQMVDAGTDINKPAQIVNPYR